MCSKAGGFDAVIGNPPYIRQEWLSPCKAAFQREFQCYAGTADAYLYFIERGLRLLPPGGRLGFITSGTFANANFAAPFRQWLPHPAAGLRRTRLPGSAAGTPRPADLKMLRGEDLRPWYYQDEGRFLIVMPSASTRMRMAGTVPLGVPASAGPSGALAVATEAGARPPEGGTPNPLPAAAWEWLAATHPSIAAHMAPFAEAAQKRTDKGDQLRGCACPGRVSARRQPNRPDR